MNLTSDRKSLFLAELRQHGIAAAAARAASPGSDHHRGALSTFRDEARRDPQFGEDWKQAVEDANANLEKEIHRRAVLGFEELRTDSQGRTTTVFRYSDSCLLAMARARLPGYAKNDVNLSGTVEHKADTLAPAVREVAARLADNIREAGQGEVDRIIRERGLANAN